LIERTVTALNLGIKETQEEGDARSLLISLACLLGAFNTGIRTGLGEEIVLPNNIIAHAATQNDSREAHGLPRYCPDRASRLAVPSSVEWGTRRSAASTLHEGVLCPPFWWTAPPASSVLVHVAMFINMLLVGLSHPS
jgi:hypothetical protein